MFTRLRSNPRHMLVVLLVTGIVLVTLFIALKSSVLAPEGEELPVDHIISAVASADGSLEITALLGPHSGCDWATDHWTDGSTFHLSVRSTSLYCNTIAQLDMQETYQFTVENASDLTLVNFNGATLSISHENQ